MTNKKTNIEILLNLKKRIFEQSEKILNYKSIVEVTNRFLLNIKEKSTKQKINEKLNLSILKNLLQKKIENLVAIDNTQVVLQQSRFWVKAITWTLMGSAAFAVGWISIAETDEIVIVRGKLEPKAGIYEVQMPVEGVAREVLVKEGQRVKKGQLLIKLDTELTAAKNNALKNKLEVNSQISSRLEELVKEGAVSEIQYLQQKSKVSDIRSEVEANQVIMKYQEITSPIDGLVFELQPKGEGFVARTSQPVMQIIPTDNLIAKVEIQSRAIGYVKTGKKVAISIDSFPASDFGVIDGKVTRIASDALPPSPQEGKDYRFPANITLDTQYLEIKSGQRLPLQAGMSLTANIKLRKVTYLKLLLNKFGSKTDSLKSI